MHKTKNNYHQHSFLKTHWKFAHSHGGTLRQKRLGRKYRPLSKKTPIHLVFKARRELLREKSFRGLRSHRLVHRLIKKYAARFYIRIDQCSIQTDHIHLLVRCSERFLYQAFFRVLAGQIAQRFQKEGLLRFVLNRVTGTQQRLWKYRPFSRIVKSFTALRIVKNYIQLNEQEARGHISYNPRRLAGLSMADWKILWSSS